MSAVKLIETRKMLQWIHHEEQRETEDAIKADEAAIAKAIAEKDRRIAHLSECLMSLAMEAKAFMSDADGRAPCVTNRRCLETRIDQACEALAGKEGT